MGNAVNDWTDPYLGKIERYLRPLPAGERIDIVAEIKSEMLELSAAGKSREEILSRLGTAEDLAQGYLGRAIAKGPAFSFRKMGEMAAFYSLAGAAWLFILPLTSLTGVGFMLGGALAPVAGLGKFVAHLLGVELPWVTMQFGSYTPGPGMGLVYSILMGGLLFGAGRFLWGLSVKIVKRISAAKKRMGA